MWDKNLTKQWKTTIIPARAARSYSGQMPTVCQCYLNHYRFLRVFCLFRSVGKTVAHQHENLQRTFTASRRPGTGNYSFPGYVALLFGLRSKTVDARRK